MKTLSTSQTSALNEDSKGIISFLKIEWPEPYGTRYYTERDFSIGVVYESKLLGFPQLRRSLGVSLIGNFIWNEYEVTLRNSSTDPNRIGEIINSVGTINGCSVTAYKVLEPLTGSVAVSDWIHFGEFRIVDYIERTHTVTLQLIDWLQQPGMKLWGTRITSDDFSSCPDKNLGLVIPYIFGTVSDAPAILVENGLKTNLSGDVLAGATVIPVDSVTGFPTSGTIVVDNEEITYTAVDSSSSPPTFGTGASPVTRGARGSDSDHSDNAAVRQKLTRYRHIVSYHVNYSNSNVRFRYSGEDYSIPSSDYTITETTLNSHPITYIDVDELPAMNDGTLLTEDDFFLILDVSGVVDPYETPDEPLSLPQNVIRYLILNSDFYGIDSARLDTTSLDSSVSDVGGNIRFSRRLHMQASCLDVLNSALFCCGIRAYWNENELRFLGTLEVDSTVDGAIERSDIFTRPIDAIEFVGPVERHVTRRDGDVVNKLIMRWEQSFVRRFIMDESSYNQTSIYEDEVSQAQPWGLRDQEVFADWIRDSTSADELGNHILAGSAWRKMTVILRTHLGFMHHEIGDILSLTDSDSQLNGDRSKIVGVAFPAPQIVQLSSIFVETRSRIWEYSVDPTNYYIDAYSGIVHIVFVLGGVTCAFIDNFGRLHASGLRSSAYTTEVVQTATDSRNGEIEYNASNDSISFALKRSSDSAYVRVFELDSTGLFRGASIKTSQSYPLTESASPSFTYHYEHFDSLNSLCFSLDLLRTFLEFERTNIGGVTNAKLTVGSFRTRRL